MIQLTILFAELNDRDLISLGQCIDREEARDQKRSFLYQVHAPTDWSELGGGHIDSDEETDDGGGGISDETASAADSPPPEAGAAQVVEVESPPQNLPDVVKNIKKEEETEIKLESSSSSVEVAEILLDSSPESVEKPLEIEPTPSTSKSPTRAKLIASTSKPVAAKRKASRDEMGAKRERLMDSSEDEHDEDLLNLTNCNQARNIQGRRLSGGGKAKILKVTLTRLEPPRGATSALISTDRMSILRWMRWTVHKKTSPDALNEPLFEYEGGDVNVKDEVSNSSCNQKKRKLSELSISDSSSPLVSSHADESSLEEGEIGEIKRGKTRRRRKKTKRSIGKAFQPSSSSSEEEGDLGECEPSISNTKGLNFSQVEEVIEVGIIIIGIIYFWIFAVTVYILHQIDDSDSEYFHSSQSNVKVKDEIVDDADADDYDEAREEGELEDDDDEAENDADEVIGQGKIYL